MFFFFLKKQLSRCPRTLVWLSQPWSRAVECHRSEAVPRGWQSCGGKVRHYTHHVHLPGGVCHRRVRFCGEPVVWRRDGPRVHASGESGAGEVCTGGKQPAVICRINLTQTLGLLPQMMSFYDEVLAVRSFLLLFDVTLNIVSFFSPPLFLGGY